MVRVADGGWRTVRVSDTESCSLPPNPGADAYKVYVVVSVGDTVSCPLKFCNPKPGEMDIVVASPLVVHSRVAF